MEKDKIGLFILRAGLGIFLLLWGIDKLVAPGSAVKIFKNFYKSSISTQLAYGFGIAEIILSILIIIGLWKTWTYGLGLAIHAVSTIASWKQLLNPFGSNHLFIAGIPVLTAFIALYLLREKDTLWTLDDR